jgi:hypothetical protein
MTNVYVKKFTHLAIAPTPTGYMHMCKYIKILVALRVHILEFLDAY